MDKKQTNERTDKITPISERNLAMMVIFLLSSLNLTGHSVFDLESGNRNVDEQINRRKTDKRTDRIIPISKGT